MTKEEHAKVLEQTQILRDIAYHLTENGYSMTGRDIKLAALEIEAAIMRKEPEPISDAEIEQAYEAALGQSLRPQDKYTVLKFGRALLEKAR